MRIYTYKQLYKPGKVITSVRKKEERISILWQQFLLMLFKSNQLFDLKSKKTLAIQELLLLKTFVITLWNIDNYQSIYVNFSIFFCILQVKAVTFWDLTTWKRVISLHTYIYVKLRYITAQGMPFLEFHIHDFVTETSFHFY